MQEKKKPRRWRLWSCSTGKNQKDEAQKEIEYLTSKGFRAKVFAPRPEHKTSGHIHVVVLCNFEELCKLAGI